MATLTKRWPAHGWRIVSAASVLVLMLYFVFSGFDYARFAAVVRRADIRFVGLIPLTIFIEQFVRAWKWRQILAPITSVPTTSVFRALMAGYVPGLVVGLGTSAISRAWLVARRDEDVSTGAVIATITVDRLIDSVAFVLFVAVALATTVLPDSAQVLRTGLAVGAGLSLVVTVLLLFTLFRYAQRLQRPARWLEERLPPRWSDWLARFMLAYGQGIVWPRGIKRGGIVVSAALIIKLLAVVQFLWAGLAIGILLPTPAYLFIMVFLGLWILIGFVIQIPGSSIPATVFVLGLFNIPREQALAMTLMVGGSFLFVYGGGGALALWLEGVGLRSVRSARNETF